CEYPGKRWRSKTARKRSSTSTSGPGNDFHDPSAPGSFAAPWQKQGSDRRRLLTPELAAEAQLVISRGCGDACPVVPGLARDELAKPEREGTSDRRGAQDPPLYLIRQRAATLNRVVRWKIPAPRRNAR